MAKKLEPEEVFITKEELLDLRKVKKDIFYFSTFINVIHPLKGKVRFDLYPFQKKVLWDFLTKRFNIVLKFRQAGITELISLYCLWLAMYHKNKTITIISIKDSVAKKVLRKIKYMYKNLPRHLRVKIINGRTRDFGTTSEIEFENGSMISSVPTTETAGRSEALSLLVIDEGAIINWASTIWASAQPTLSTGGQAIVNSCVTGDTVIIGQNGNFKIEDVCPENFGRKDISSLGLKVLSHTGKWQRVLGSVNKGILKTWEVKNKFGDTLKCTPHHKLYTPQGWKTVKEIIEKNLNTIIYQTGLDDLKPLPVTIPPKQEIIKPIKGFPNYKVSNLGKVYIDKNGKFIEKEGRLNSWGYLSLSLWNSGKKKKITISRLVAETFIGKIPKNYVVDHINFNITNNYVTNLQIITKSENLQRTIPYSRSLKLGCKIGKGFANITLIGWILEKYQEYGDTQNYQKRMVEECYNELGIKLNPSYITRTAKKTRTKNVHISKLTLVRKYLAKIYDISVENDQSYITNSNFVSHNTPYGIGNWFHQTWVEALAGGNDFNPIRLRWEMHPERDQHWYDTMKRNLGPRRTAQEIDGDFLSSGYSVFDLMDIKAIEDSLSDLSPLEIKYNGSLIIYNRPKKDKSYFIGADIATGRAKDYSTFTIMDREGEEQGCFKGKIPVEKFAKLLYDIGYKYNGALLAPEANDIGLAVVKLLQEWKYPNIYYSTHMIREKGASKPKQVKLPGWTTNSKNRPIIIDELERDISNDLVIIKDPFFVQEAYTFIYNDLNKPIALGKNKNQSNSDDDFDSEYTDDAILGKSITNFVRKGKINNIIVTPE